MFWSFCAFDCSVGTISREDGPRPYQKIELCAVGMSIAWFYEEPILIQNPSWWLGIGVSVIVLCFQPITFIILHFVQSRNTIFFCCVETITSSHIFKTLMRTGVKTCFLAQACPATQHIHHPGAACLSTCSTSVQNIVWGHTHTHVFIVYVYVHMQTTP